MLYRTGTSVHYNHLYTYKRELHLCWCVHYQWFMMYLMYTSSHSIAHKSVLLYLAFPGMMLCNLLKINNVEIIMCGVFAAIGDEH